VLATVAAILAIAVAVALVFLFADDRAPAGATGGAAPSHTANPTPTPTPLIQPAVPFDGDCAQVLTGAQLDDLLGIGWRTRAEAYAYAIANRPDSRALALQTLGGLECDWVASGEDVSRQGSSLGVVVLPSDRVPASFAADYAALRCDPGYGVTECRVGGVAGDAWVMVRDTGVMTEQPPAEFLLQALDEVSATVEGRFDGRAADRQAEWLTLPRCEALAEETRLQEIVGEGYRNGYWEGSQQPEETLLAQAGVSATCPWHTGSGQRAPDGGFYILGATMIAGAAWAWDHVAMSDGATPVEVEGAADAVVFTDGGNVELVVSDGVNLLSLGGADADVLAGLARRVIAALQE
ncbi:MAG: hypothetical protein ACRCSL_02535, partial [Microbacterium sp.]